MERRREPGKVGLVRFHRRNGGGRVEHRVTEVQARPRPRRDR